MAYSKSIVNPPDFTHIPGGLHVGSEITVRGRVPHGSERFSINLKMSDDEDADNAFHFNPRNDQESVVRNSFQSGWQEEELDIPYFPFAYGMKFTVRIFVGEDFYSVLVNGQHFIDFGHRLSFADVRYVMVTEGAEYYEVSVRNQCRVPFSGQFPGGLKSGRALMVRGCVNDDADRFAINFNCDPEGDTVGVHFNPRQDSDVVVMNSKIGDWGEEERDHNGFPFEKGQFFNISFITYHDTFQIYVNDKFFTSYAFRVPPEDIRFLAIEGDVTLMDVDFADPLDDGFVKAIPSGLEKDDLIQVKGFFYPEGQRFAINLLHGSSPDDDVALHFNPRRDQGEVVLNSKEGGNWKDEEKHDLPDSMKEMVPFCVDILNKKDKFKIYINGIKLASFDFRDGEEVRGINVNGEAYIYQVKLLRKVDSPYVDRLPGRLVPGSWVSVTGTPDDDAERFAINLQTGDSNSYGDDIAFHYNPRFDENVTVRNSMFGEWGDEERDESDFPFKLEDRFEVIILVKPDFYRVFVNGRHHIDYGHRMDPSSLNHIMVTGLCDFFEPEFY